MGAFGKVAAVGRGIAVARSQVTTEAKRRRLFKVFSGAFIIKRARIHSFDVYQNSREGADAVLFAPAE